MDESSLSCYTDLSGVEKASKSNIECCLLDVNIRQDDAWVIAAPATVSFDLLGEHPIAINSQFQSHTFHSPYCISHDSLSRRCGSGERYLADIGMLDQCGTKTIISIQSLKNAGWKNLLCDLGGLQSSVSKLDQRLATLRKSDYFLRGERARF